MNTPAEIRLRTLGPVGLTRPDGSDITAVLSQPKRLAILVYLAVCNGGAFCRRDTVLGMFWPEFDQERARAALRKALHFLRRELGDGVIVTRGDEEVGLDTSQLTCDVLDFRAAVDVGRAEAGLDLYEGAFLEGFHVGVAPFDRWRDEVADELRGDAVQAAERLTRDRMASGDAPAAVRTAEAWTRLAPYNEAAAEALMSALDATGDRSGALQAYEALGRRLRDLEVEPSEQAAELAETIRSHSPAPDTPGLGTGQARPERRRLVLLSVGAALLAVVAVAAFAGLPRATDDRTTVAVLAFENLTADPALDPLGTVYRRAALDGLALVERTRLLDRETDQAAVITVTGSYHRDGDSLEVGMEIVDRARGRVLPAPPPVRVGLADPATPTGELRRRARAAVAYYTSTWHPTNPARRPPDWEAYVTFQQAFYTSLGWMYNEPNVVARADSLYRRVLDLDPHYSEAYLLLGNFVLGQQLPREPRAAFYQRGRPDASDSLAQVMRTRLTPMTSLDRAIANGMEAYARADYASLIRWSQEQDLPSRPHVGILFAAGASNRPGVALSHVAKLDYSDWTFDFWLAWWWLAVSHHLAGDYAGEAAVVDSAQARPYLRYDFLLEEIRSKTALGNLTRVRELTQSPSFDVAHFGGLELRAHGLARNDAETLAESDRLLNWLVQRFRTQPESGFRNLIFYWALFATGHVDELVPRFERIARDSSHLLDIPGMLGAAYARLGNVAAADSIDKVLADADPSGLRGLVSLWRARIAAQLGEKDRAVQLLDQAFREGTWFQANMPVDGGFWHTDPHFEPLRDYPPYQRLIAPNQ